MNAAADNLELAWLKRENAMLRARLRKARSLANSPVGYGTWLYSLRDVLDLRKPLQKSTKIRRT